MMSGPVLLATSHGTSDSAGATAVAALVEAVAAADPGIRVIGGFVDVQQPDVPTCLERTELDDTVILVPLLLSAGYHVYVDLAEASQAAAQVVHVTAALGPDERLIEILAERLIGAGFRSGDRVILAAAGSSDARACADCHRVGEQLSARLGQFVVVAFLSAAEPRLRGAILGVRVENPTARVFVATYLLAPGYFADMAIAAGADVTTPPLLMAGVAPHPKLVELVHDRYLAGIAATRIAATGIKATDSAATDIAAAESRLVTGMFRPSYSLTR